MLGRQTPIVPLDQRFKLGSKYTTILILGGRGWGVCIIANKDIVGGAVY